MNYDLVIAYRLYPGVSKKPLVHEDNKMKLAELGVASLKLSLDKLRVKLYFILDSCPLEYEAMVLRYFPAPDSEIIHVSKAGNFATFNMQIELLCRQSDSEYIYFAEDDYVYKPGEFKSMLEFIKENPKETDFVTCNDHLDYYTTPQHKFPVSLKQANGKHWFTACSTCLTFLTTKSTLQKTRKVFESFSKGNYDISLWLVLTKYHLFNPLSLVKFAGNRLMLKALVKAWLHTFVYVLILRKRKLWVPITSVGTHLQYNEVAPNIDWLSVINNIETNYIAQQNK